MDWNNLGESLTELLIMEEPSAASKQAEADGLHYISFGNYSKEKGGPVVAKTDNGKLTYIDGEDAGDAGGAGAEKPAEKQPQSTSAVPPKETEEKPKVPSQGKNRVTDGADSEIKNSVVQNGFVKTKSVGQAGGPAPGSASSALNEIMTGEVIHMIRENPLLHDRPKEIVDALLDKFGNTKLFKQNKSGLQRKLLSTVLTGITENERVDQGLEHMGWPKDSQVDHYYGAQDSLTAMTEAVEKAPMIMSPQGREIPKEDMLEMIRASGHGENPSDTAIFTAGPDGSLVIMFTSNKLSIADNQANSTLNKELENGLELLNRLAKGGQYSKEQIAAGGKGLKASKAIINKIEKELTGTIGKALAKPALENPRIREEFIAKLATAAPNEQARWASFKKGVGTEDDATAAKVFFEQMSTRTPTKDEAKILTRVLEGIKGVPSAAQVSAVSRGKIIDSISNTRKIMDKIKGKNGMGLGTTIEAENLIDKLHLEAAFKGSTVGVHAYPGLYEANMGGIRVTGELLAKCIGANNREQFVQNFAIEDPQPVTDKQGNITGAKSETFYEDDQGRITKIGKREVRSKQGISGTLETAYKYTGETQRCLKAGGKTNEEVNMRENLNGPGEKTKSGGVARGGRISQKPQQGGQDARGGQSGAAAGAATAGPEPQAQSGEPNPKEDELEKDYLEMDDEPLQPQSPLGKLIAKEFDQPIGEPKGADEDKPEGGEEKEGEVEEGGWKASLIHPDEIEKRNQPKKVKEATDRQNHYAWWGEHPTIDKPRGGPAKDTEKDKPVKEGHKNKSSRQGRSKARAGKRQVRIDRQAAKRKGPMKEAPERYRPPMVKSLPKRSKPVNHPPRPVKEAFQKADFQLSDLDASELKTIVQSLVKKGYQAKVAGASISTNAPTKVVYDLHMDMNPKSFKKMQEDYQGDEQSVTDAAGKEIDVDEDAYKTAQKTEPTEVQQMDAAFTVQTKEGPAEGKKGDYLAKGVDGEQWPIDQAIFDKTHEFVNEAGKKKKTWRAVKPRKGEDDRGVTHRIPGSDKSDSDPARPGTRMRFRSDMGEFVDPEIQTEANEKWREPVSVKDINPKTKTRVKAMQESGEKDERGGYPVETYKGWKIWTLPSYDTPYYYATAQRDNGKRVFGSVDHYRTLRQLKNRMDKFLKKIGKTELGEGSRHGGSLSNISQGGDDKWAKLKGEAVTTKDRTMTPARAQVLNRYNTDMKFKGQLDRAWSVWRNANASPTEKQRVAKFLKSLGLVEAMREALRSSGGATGGMKRTSGSTEWGKTRKTGKTSSGNLRRSATKAARQAGRKQAQQYDEDSPRTYKGVQKRQGKKPNLTQFPLKLSPMTPTKKDNLKEGTVLKVRPDLWAAKNAIGEVKHFTAPKIAVMFANSKGKDDFGVWSSIREAMGGRWITNARHFQPEGDAGIKTATPGMVAVDEDGSEFLGKDTLNPEEMKIIDTHWKNILRFAKVAFKAKPLPVALRAIEGYLEKLGVDESHTMKIGEILAAQLNKDRDPISMIIPKVIPKIQQEPYSKGSGYNAGGAGGMGPT